MRGIPLEDFRMKISWALAVVGALVAAQLHAACPYPKAPEKLPDGSTATREEMISGQHAVKQYDKDMSVYLACLDDEYKSAVEKGGETLTPEKKAEMQRLQDQKHNAAVDELEGLAGRFNEQVKTYKARSDKSKG
jgi:hypothetical protein